MDDILSIKSSDSTTSDDYEFITSSSGTPKSSMNQDSKSPLLKIVGNGDLAHLQKCLGEVLRESEIDSLSGTFDCHAEVAYNEQSANDNNNAATVSNTTRYDVGDDEEEQLEPIEDVYQECTLFGCISYLGSAAINAPKSKTEILRNMIILNEQQSSFEQAIKISVSVPNSLDGVVVLYDGINNSVMARYDVTRIMLYTSGAPGTNEESCFAFTYLHGDAQETAIFQCHVFRCDIFEAVRQVTLCFGRASQRPVNSMNSSTQSVDQSDASDVISMKMNTQLVILEVGFEIKENDGKSNYSSVPRDKNVFKLRTNIEKQICFTIQQVLSADQPEFDIERCFGVLISPGCNVKHSDMQLLDTMSMNIRSNDDEDGQQKIYIITGNWNPKEPAFHCINSEVSKLYLTVAVDLVIRRIREPVRLTLEIQIKVFPQNERFWYFSKPAIFHQFNLCLKEMPIKNGSIETVYEVDGIERSGELEKSRLSYTWTNLANLIRTVSSTSLEGGMSPNDDFSDSDEPVVSGTGVVSKECPDEELEVWHDLLAKWTNSSVRPKQLTLLVRRGIPEALRGELWQRLVQCEQDSTLVNTYRILISKECNCERTIQKDINRTFPTHDYFKEAGGVGQDTLFNISKAYAVYDTEVGYCQGLTFIAASLLLHMPEEQAFCVLVKLMYDYGLRNLYRDGFEALYMRLYQLNRLLEEKEPQLWQHFKDTGIETHMFASHWFLTLYTARFPLYFVFLIIDVTLVYGLDMIFQIALSLHSAFKKELLSLDFENILKFYQVTLPKKCRNQWLARNLIKRACNLKLKKLKKYEREFVKMRASQDNGEQYNVSELEKLKLALSRSEEDKRILEQNLNELRSCINAEREKNEATDKRNERIISEYKQICQRLDKEQTSNKLLLERIQKKIRDCNRCRCLIEESEELNVGDKGFKDSSGGTSVANGISSEDELDICHRVNELEVELGLTKFSLVEAECRNQALKHELSATCSELHAVKKVCPPWLQKTLVSIKEATAASKIL